MVTAANTIMFQGCGIGIFSHSAQVSVSLAAATKKITRTSGDWTAGQTPVEVGMYVTLEDAAALANKKVCGKVIAVTALDITTDAPLTDATAATITLRFFHPLGLITGWSGPQMTAEQIDVTHSESIAAESKADIPKPGQFSFNGNAGRGDKGIVKFRALRISRVNTDFVIADADRLGFERFNGGFSSYQRTGALGNAITYDGSAFVSGDPVNSEDF